MIVVTGLCDLVKTVVDVIDDSSEVPNYQIISPIVLLLSAVSVCVCVLCVFVCSVCDTACVCVEYVYNSEYRHGVYVYLSIYADQ